MKLYDCQVVSGVEFCMTRRSGVQTAQDGVRWYPAAMGLILLPTA